MAEKCGINTGRKEFDGVNYVVLDLETTGLNCGKDQVIEIGAVRIAQGTLQEEFSTLVNPGCSIPEEITELTGIDDEMVKNMPFLTEVLPQLDNFLQGAVLIGHNIQFDLSFLKSYITLPENYLDTVEMAKILFPYAPGYSLDELAYSLDIDRSSAHRALGDARTTGLLFLRLQQILKDLDFVVLETLFLLSQKTKSTLSCLFAQVYRQRMSSFPREGIKSRQLYSQGDMRMGIFSSHPQPEFIEDYEITPEELAPIFQPGGRMETMIQGFRYRPEQEEMAKETARCWNQGGYLIVEAGTGIGKSLAYLLPSVLWSINAGHKVIVSTHTIHLQEQLKNKDIPLAAKISGRDFSSSVIKGRSHYLCLRKWEQFINESNQEILRLIMRLAIWLNQTETGDIDELNLNKKEKADWQHLAAASETCLGIKCKFYRGQCFVSRARKLAEQSQIIIVNHSLLLANAMANDNILPEYKYLVIDEAHQLEKTAEEQFTIDINYFALWAVFQKLIKGGNPSSRNILEHLTKKMVNHPNLDQDLRDELISLLEDIGLIGEECLSAAREFFGVISGIFSANWSDNIPYTQTMRILPWHRKEDYWPGIVSAGENLMIKLKGLIKKLISLGEKTGSMENEYGIEINEAAEINMIVSNLHQIVTGLEIILMGDEENFVSWMEYQGNNNFLLLRTSPIDVKEQLYHYLFSSKKGVILTSATLTVGGKFNYFTESIGLDLAPFPLKTIQLPSPFDYEENVLLAIASDLPEPSSSSEILFTDRICKTLIKLIKAAQGRTLVLFTSHYQLKDVYQNIKSPLNKDGITVYAHGVTGSRTKILDDFKNKENSVILGANSFWEGIDVVGEALTLVIIVKLPFWPPTIPTVSARLDRYQALNLDGFRWYSLPQAIIRFKQGFGRLIRSHSDYGAICILDKRIYQKKYGASFINSLPKMKTIIGQTDELAEDIRNWLRAKTK